MSITAASTRRLAAVLIIAPIVAFQNGRDATHPRPAIRYGRPAAPSMATAAAQQEYTQRDAVVVLVRGSGLVTRALNGPRPASRKSYAAPTPTLQLSLANKDNVVDGYRPLDWRIRVAPR